MTQNSKIRVKTIQPLREPIDDSRCERIDIRYKSPIEAISAPLVVGEDLSIEELESLSDPQRELLWANHEVWGIIGHWLAALRSGCNTKKYPFTLQAYKDRESFARLLNAQWELCIEAFDLTKRRLPYKSGTEWFVATAREIRQWQVKHILYASHYHRQKLKTAKVVGIRDFVKQLEQGENPLVSDEPITKHHYLLFEVSLRLAQRLNELQAARKTAKRKNQERENQERAATNNDSEKKGPIESENYKEKLERQKLNARFQPTWTKFRRLYKSYATDIAEGGLQSVKVVGEKLVHMKKAHTDPEPIDLLVCRFPDLKKSLLAESL